MFVASDITAADGARLHAVTQGEGAEIILLHPTPVDHSFWLPLTSQMSGRYRVTIPDLRGHGLSELGRDPLMIATLARDVEEWMNAAGVKEAIFAGCSIGGYILYELWRRMPHRVRALAFCCSKPQPDAPANRAKRLQNMEAIRAHGPSGFFDQMTESLVGSAFRKDEPAKVTELRSRMNALTPEAVIAVQQCLMDRPDSVPILHWISVPVLALAAEEDQASTPEEMKIVAEMVPGAEFHLLPGAGHYAPFEQPEIVGGILSRFFSRV